MDLGEFNLIGKFFAPRYDVPGLLGVGDDGAILPAQGPLYTAQAGWRRDRTPRSAASVGEQLINTVTSALDQQGAAPRWLFLSLTLPSVDLEWLEAFSAYVLTRCHNSDMYLVGGDTTRGILAVDLFCLGVAA